MDAATRYNRAKRVPVGIHTQSRKRSNSSENLDRFIPNRSAMDLDFAHFMLSGGKVMKENSETFSPSKEAYRKRLAAALNMNRSRILCFRNKPASSPECSSVVSADTRKPKCSKRHRVIPQVCSLLWSKLEHELLSSHGFHNNQLVLWNYPSMLKMADLQPHTSRVLNMAHSPDGCTVATVAGDETLCFSNVFGDPQLLSKQAPKSNPQPFSNLARIR